MVQTVRQPDNMIKVTWQFSIGVDATSRSEIEEFSVYGLAFPAGFVEGDWDQYLKDLAHPAYTAWGGNVDARNWSPNLTLESVKTTRFDTLGKTKTEAVHTTDSKWKGTSTAGPLPWQTAVCVGLYTYTPGSFIADARTRRGRIYLPTPSLAAVDGQSGHLKPNLAQELADSTNSIIRETALMNGSTVDAWRWSPGILSKGPFVDGRQVGAFNHLTDLTCDSRFDTQRRRANKDAPPRFTARYVGFAG